MSNTLSEIDDGRDVPWFREEVYEQTEWYLQHPEIHVPFLTQFLLFRILEGERVPLAREVQEWPLISISGPQRKSSTAVKAALIRRAIPFAFVFLLFAASGWIDGTLSSLAARLNMPIIANHVLLWVGACVLAEPAVAAMRRLIGESGSLYSPITRALGNRLPLLGRELGAICREVEKSGYDGPTIAERLSNLQKRGLIVNSMAYGLLRLAPVPGERKFRPNGKRHSTLLLRGSKCRTIETSLAMAQYPRGHFLQEFSRRTLKNIGAIQAGAALESQDTALISFLLAVFVLPRERSEEETYMVEILKSYSKPLESVVEILKCRPYSPENGKGKPPSRLEQLPRCLRNAVAHFYIRPESQDEQNLTHLLMWDQVPNKNRKHGGKITFVARINLDELRCLATHILKQLAQSEVADRYEAADPIKQFDQDWPTLGV